MSHLPRRLGDPFGNERQAAKAARAQERTELAIFEHHLQIRYLAECDFLDAQAVADVTKNALEGELANMDWGLEQAAGSPAKAELVARHVALQSRLNNARIGRHFGGQ